MQNQRPLIFKINRLALDDGPGIRTVIFFKGCMLRCVWCHSPESWVPGYEIGFYQSDCLRYINEDGKPGKKPTDICHQCVEKCPTKAIEIDNNERITIDRKKCKSCHDRNDHRCVEACPGLGLRKIGQYYKVDELVDIILRDLIYYQTSGGGVTLSGGEPALLQNMDYVSQLLWQLKRYGIHTAIETCGFYPYSEFETKLLPYLDLILFDIKLADQELHRKNTGKGNDVILNNFTKLVEESYRKKCSFKNLEVIPRIPLIPGKTAKRDNLKKIVAILKDMGISRCWLLPYNPTGYSKWAVIGQEPPMTVLEQMQLEHLQSEKEISDIKEFFHDEKMKLVNKW